MKYTVVDVEKYEVGNKEEIDEALRTCNEIPELLKTPLRPLWVAGSWLGTVLRDMGASDEETSDICFAHGQRCFGRDPVQAALVLANEYAEFGTTADKPGAELAEKIHQELVQDIGSEANG